MWRVFICECDKHNDSDSVSECENLANDSKKERQIILKDKKPWEWLSLLSILFGTVW